jgi:hypothetical protein
MSPSVFPIFNPKFKQYGIPMLISVADLYVDCISIDYSNDYSSYRYLIRTLNLLPSNSTRPSIVSLHEVENALSALVAAMFWTCKWWNNEFKSSELIRGCQWVTPLQVRRALLGITKMPSFLLEHLQTLLSYYLGKLPPLN